MPEFLEVDRSTTARNHFQSWGQRGESAVSTGLYNIYFQLVGRKDLQLCQRGPILTVPVGRNQCESLKKVGRKDERGDLSWFCNNE